MSVGDAAPLDPRTFNSVFSKADKVILRIDKTKEPSQNLKIARLASKAVSEVSQAFEAKPFQVTPKNISNLSRLVFDIYTAKEKIKTLGKENTARTTATLESITEETLKILLPGAPEELIKTAKLVLEDLLKVILYDVTEEVVGQERPPGSIVQILNRMLKVEHGIEDPRMIKNLAMALYPLALLAATYDPRVKTPSAESRQSHLDLDGSQFTREYKSQFGHEALQGMSESFFKNCLEQVWILKASRVKKES